MKKAVDTVEVFKRYLKCDEKFYNWCTKPCEKCKYNWNGDELKAAMEAVIEREKNDNRRSN